MDRRAQAGTLAEADYKAQANVLRDVVRRNLCSPLASGTVWRAADTIEALSRQLDYLQGLLDACDDQEGAAAEAGAAVPGWAGHLQARFLRTE